MEDMKDKKGLDEIEGKKLSDQERKSEYEMKADQDGLRESVGYAYKLEDEPGIRVLNNHADKVVEKEGDQQKNVKKESMEGFDPVVSTDYNMKRQGEYTVEDYYALSEDKRMELINGVLYEMLSPTYIHQKLILEIGLNIKGFIREKGGLCQVFIAPFDVKLCEDNRTMVEPDIFIVCDPEKVKYWGIDGAPDFVIEIVSPSSKKRDYVLKVSKYMEAGVREYWIIDPIKESILIYCADNDLFPYLGSLSGKMPVGIYGGKLEIDLDEIQKEIEKSKLLEQ